MSNPEGSLKKTQAPGIRPPSSADPLLVSLVILARETGRRTNLDTLTAGLPSAKEGAVTPAFLARAAERIGMLSRHERILLDDIVSEQALPCILALKDKKFCVLKSVSSTGFLVIFPDKPDSGTLLPQSELEKKYDGHAFLFRPSITVDDRAGPAVIATPMEWFWGNIRKHRNTYRRVVLASLLINLFALAVPLFTMTVYDRILPNLAFDTLWVLSAGVVIAAIFEFVIKNLRARFLDVAGRKADVRISAEIFAQIQAMKMNARPANSGILVDAMRGFETLREFFTSSTIVTLVDLPFILLFIILIGMIGGPIVLIPIVLIGLILLFGHILQKPLSQVVDQNTRETSYKNSLLMETLSGLETLRLRAAESFNQRKWEEIVEQASLSGVKARTLAALGVNFTGLVTNLGTVAIIVYGAHLFADGRMTMGALVACVILAGRVIAPLAQVASVLTRLSQSRSALLRLDMVMQAPTERARGVPLVPKSSFSGKITFRDITFRYPGQQGIALNKVSFDVLPGERVGIIGSVGSGKTTLQRLVMNLYQPDQGAVEIDGMDVRQMEPGNLRRAIGVAQQDAYMFFGSVRDNITLGDESVSDEMVVRAANLAGLGEFFRDSPAGLATPVGERGEKLSGGQRQSISVARALLYDPPILILDEPTASMDPKSEKFLFQRLLQACEGKTVLMNTHRYEILGLVGKLVLMDKGQVVAAGPRDAVLKALTEKKIAPAGGAGDGERPS